MILAKGQPTFSGKDNIVKDFNSEGHTASTISTQLCHCGMKAPRDKP